MKLMMLEPFVNEITNVIISLGGRILISAITFIIGIVLIGWIKKLVKKSMKKFNVEAGAAGFVSSLVVVALYIVLGFVIAATFGVDAASIVALLGSAGVTIGLAIQGSLSNLAGGILIIFLKPFKVGDYIIEDNNGNEGTVTDISLFYTKLQTIDEKTVILPNGTLANTSLTNVTYTPKRLLELKFYVTYDADWKRGLTILEEVLKAEQANVSPEETEVFLAELANEGVCLGGRVMIKNEEFRFARQRITAIIKEKFDSEDISFAYPYIKIFRDEQDN